MGGTFGPILLLGSLFGLLVLGMPIAYALGLSAVITAVFAGVPLEAVWLKVSDGVDNFALLAIPFFVFAGALMAEGGMAWRLRPSGPRQTQNKGLPEAQNCRRRRILSATPPPKARPRTLP